MKRSLMFAAVAATLATPTQGHAVERVEWVGEPISVRLNIDQERRLIIGNETEVRVGLLGAAAGKIVVQSIGRNVWLRALEPIESARMLLQSHPANITVVIDVYTEDDPDDTGLPTPIENLVIMLPETPIGVNGVRPETSPFEPPPGFAALTRFVVRELYAPVRLRIALNGVNRYPAPHELDELFRCGGINIPSSCGGALSIEPLAAWQSETHYVTAVLLTNTLEQPLVLDPRDLRGAWRAATFIRSRLMPAGQPDAATVLVLISDAPASEALNQ